MAVIAISSVCTVILADIPAAVSPSAPARLNDPVPRYAGRAAAHRGRGRARRAASGAQQRGLLRSRLGACRPGPALRAAVRGTRPRQWPAPQPAVPPDAAHPGRRCPQGLLLERFRRTDPGPGRPGVRAGGAGRAARRPGRAGLAGRRGRAAVAGGVPCRTTRDPARAGPPDQRQQGRVRGDRADGRTRRVRPVREDAGVAERRTGRGTPVVRPGTRAGRAVRPEPAAARARPRGPRSYPHLSRRGRARPDGHLHPGDTDGITTALLAFLPASTS
ncbi:hypothetical protein FB471_5469 [Amycolatopsis cihanbeyliensis]|uniref:Uncharacterized protein n=1 Tax=Amycolatopsis cihanbeyliensis TaxID=1128664 RepID=A0A542DR94_AMYCI|nr:hypothetical protein FB471_5469 [Amycolatopsis cihanbeyliensis]